MATEQTGENRVQTPTQQNSEHILKRLTDYLSVRFDHAARIEPKLLAIKQDLTYHEMANVRRCLDREKIYGPIRLCVADVFMGDDDRKRMGLMSPSDQTSIQVEIVSHCQDERVEATRGQIKIHDLKTFYASINPQLSAMMDLIETWIWWDILDAAELARFEQKVGIIKAAQTGKLPGELRKRYQALLQPEQGADEAGQQKPVTADEVIKYELKNLLHIRERWAYRRGDEMGYKWVLKRDEEAGVNQGELIHRIASKVREYDQVERAAELDEAVRHRYAADLRVTPDRVTRESLLEHLQEQLIALEREMLARADHDSRLGAPYNYKVRQMDLMDKWLRDLRNQLAPLLAENTPAQPAPRKTPADAVASPGG